MSNNIINNYHSFSSLFKLGFKPNLGDTFRKSFCRFSFLCFKYYFRSWSKRKNLSKVRKNKIRFFWWIKWFSRRQINKTFRIKRKRADWWRWLQFQKRGNSENNLIENLLIFYGNRFNRRSRYAIDRK